MKTSIHSVTITLSNGSQIVMSRHQVTWIGFMASATCTLNQFEALLNAEISRRNS